MLSCDVQAEAQLHVGSGIVFHVDETEYRCWVWFGAADELPDGHTLLSVRVL